MKKTIILSVIASSLLLFGCKSKDKGAASSDSTANSTSAEPTTTSGETTSPANEPKTYTLTFSPDSATLGKSKEASIKLLPGTATELANPDGTSQGTEVTFKLTLTSKIPIGGNAIGISPSDFRLMLDNNTSISQTNGGYFSTQPESTSESETITYRIPAGAKPKALNLFYDETRASVQVALK
ncbi:hypothetical protein ADIARSV_1741 [Arcticibacter svalbardensis MN12-7]|uniref:Lipoprotein n=1 Tax=Arcticibacter svalbardensis MN12-7 TaxID=1150600 RepID=R9GTP4_9SPHI|nr:hypothetical protein [Arcticibacter svalbardensis]EOR95081.1 hypothetical protein ADIARSV_1741 [Arcticibacter svalbardensis MN12-7]